jgi:hypothetical protein
MKYEKPEITISTEAVTEVQGSKLGGTMDFAEPQNPIHSSAAYQSDE